MPSPPDSDQSSTTVDRRLLVMGGAMLLTAGLAAVRQPNREIDLLGHRKLDALIPATIGPWKFVTTSGLVVPPEDQLSQQLYAQLLTRSYSAPGLPSIMLLVTQGNGQTGVVQVHRPEVCYPAGGYRLTNAHPLDLPVGHGTLRTQAFTATADSRIEQLMYWTRIGYALPTSWFEQRMAVARANLKREIPDAALIRVSTIMGDQAAAFDAIRHFVEEMLRSVPPQARRFLLGPSLASAA